MSKQEYKDHPLSSLLPMMGQMEIQELAADIHANGLRSEIVLLDGQILDGRNRYRACNIVGVPPKFRDFNGQGDPVAFIVSANIKRRHLTNAQREIIAAKLANLPRGDVSRFSEGSSQTAKRQYGGKSVSEAAKELEVSPRNVARAREVLRTAPAVEIAAIEQGEKKVGTVARETKERTATEEKHFDKTGYSIPEIVLEDWQRADEQGRSWLTKISQVRSELKSALEDRDVIVASLTNTTLADLNNAYTSLKCAIPYAVCTSCQGHLRKKCGLCKHRGFLDEFAWRSFVAPEVKRLRKKRK
ncbi:MAG: hypothetical protein ABR568_13990 [Pyrinomonadaceae bacterium]